MIWLTICINASKKILLQSHSIKSIINLIIRCEEILSITSKSAPINSYQIIQKFELNHQKLLKPNSTKIVQLIINITNKTSTNRVRKIKANVNLQIIHSSIKLTGIKLGSFSQTSHDWGKFKKKKIVTTCNEFQVTKTTVTILKFKMKNRCTKIAWKQNCNPPLKWFSLIKLLSKVQFS